MFECCCMHLQCLSFLFYMFVVVLVLNLMVWVLLLAVNSWFLFWQGILLYSSNYYYYIGGLLCAPLSQCSWAYLSRLVVCVRACVHTCVHVNLGICMCIHVFTCMCIHIPVRVHACTCVYCTYVCECRNGFLCKWVFRSGRQMGRWRNSVGHVFLTARHSTAGRA